MKNHGFERIVLATDDSPQAEAAAGVAASFAQASNAAVRVVHVWNLEVHHRHGVWDIETRSEAEALIRRAVSRLRAAGVQADGLISRADHNHVAAAIAEVARAFDAELVVVGSRGLSDWQAMWQHSVSHDVLSSVDCPVLVVRGTDATVHGPQRVLLALAGGDDVGRGVRAALAAASAPGSSILVVHVAQALFGAQGFAYVETDEEIKATVESAMAMLRDRAGLTVETSVAEPAPVARQVAEEAARWRADVIVVGSSRVGNVTSMLFGSVTHELLRGTPIPVLVAERS